MFVLQSIIPTTSNQIFSLLSLSQKITVLIREHVYQIRTVKLFGPLKNFQYFWKLNLSIFSVYCHTFQDETSLFEQNNNTKNIQKFALRSWLFSDGYVLEKYLF